MKKNNKKPKGRSRLKLTTLIKLLDFDNINFSVGKKESGRGRPPLDFKSMLRAFMVMTFKGFSERGLEIFLRHYPFWSRLCGFKGNPPCHASFSNFKRRIGEDTLKEVMRGLVDKLVESGSINLVTVAVDSSTLDAALKDREAAWGYTWEGPFYGYKVHFVCCTDSELPVSLAVTPGNVHDSTQCIPLIRDARKINRTISYMVADTAYDSLEIYETLMEKYHIISVVPFNPRNGEKTYDYGIQRLYYFETAFLKPLYRRRTAVERVNNIVTKELGLDYLRYKGLRAVTFQAYITCLLIKNPYNLLTLSSSLYSSSNYPPSFEFMHSEHEPW
jgi:transposase